MLGTSIVSKQSSPALKQPPFPSQTETADKVYLYDGDSTTNSALVATLKGRVTTLSKYSTTGSAAVLKFVTDGSVQYTGFRITYAIGKKE